MGKGLAYRFKQRYPLNNEYYTAACQRGQVRIGHILFFDEVDKTIANFPTKDKWREGSRYEYIEAGLEDLKAQLTSRAIASVAIPPLGCGNGGLEWHRVKSLIEKYLASLDAHVYLHTPLNDSSTGADYKLGVSHLVLMRLKCELEPFSASRLEAAATLVDTFCGEKLFCLVRQLDALCQQIRAFQQANDVSTDEAQNILCGNLTSASLEGVLSKSASAITTAVNIVNLLHTDHELELVVAVVCALKERADSTADEIAAVLWDRFINEEIRTMISWLEGVGIFERTLLGLRVKDFT